MSPDMSVSKAYKTFKIQDILIADLNIISAVPVPIHVNLLPVKRWLLSSIKSFLQLFNQRSLARLPEESHLCEPMLSDKMDTLLYHQRSHVIPIPPLIQDRLLQPLTKHTCDDKIQV